MATELVAMEAGIRTEAYRRATEARGCECREDARATLLTSGLAEHAGPELSTAVTAALQNVDEGQPIDLEDTPLGEFKFGDDRVDSQTVEVAADMGKGNMVAYAIIRDAGCRFPRRTAANLMQAACPNLMLTSATIRATTPTPPPAAPARGTGAAPTPMETETEPPQQKPQPGPFTEDPEGEGEP